MINFYINIQKNSKLLKIDQKHLHDHFDTELVSGFTQFLIKTLGKDKAVKIIEMYYLGFYESDVIFWQIDTDKNLRAGKLMAYNEVGKRQGIPRWWHRIKGGTCQLNQCFFGEHLIPYINKSIAIVESEKTACVMTIINMTLTPIGKLLQINGDLKLAGIVNFGTSKV